MAVIPLIRQGVLGAATVFSIIELAVSARLISQTQQYFGFTAIFCALAVAVAVISLVTLPVMLIVDFLRRGAFTSLIVVELAWMYILCILWVATAGETTSEFNNSFPVDCTFVDPIFNGMCQEAQVIEAFSFLNFIITLLYAVGLTVLALIAANRGQAVWLSSVTESFGPSGALAQYPMSQHQTLALPQPPVISEHTTGTTQPSGATLGGPVYV